MTSDRFPLITEEGHRLLRQLEEHPHAPRYTHPGYNRLTAEGLRRAKAFAAELRTSPPLWRHGEVPAWLPEFVAWCYREVPFYRRHGPPPATLFPRDASRSELEQSLEARFGCPILDMYSMNESGPIASAEPEGRAYHLLQPRLYVEILDPEGAPCPPGVRGEITLSGGFNPFLPLLRYRTGDFAGLEFRSAQPLLVGLKGRPPVTFRTADGRPVNNVDISIALRPFPIAQYALHQSADSALHLKVHAAGVDQTPIREALLALFGADQVLNMEEVESWERPEGKVIQYTSDLSDG